MMMASILIHRFEFTKTVGVAGIGLINIWDAKWRSMVPCSFLFCLVVVEESTITEEGHLLKNKSLTLPSLYLGLKH